jgi:hypothetical protein
MYFLYVRNRIRRRLATARLGIRYIVRSPSMMKNRSMNSGSYATRRCPSPFLACVRVRMMSDGGHPAVFSRKRDRTATHREPTGGDCWTRDAEEPEIGLELRHFCARVRWPGSLVTDAVQPSMRMTETQLVDVLIASASSASDQANGCESGLFISAD